jgi:hypothetical protein
MFIKESPQTLFKVFGDYHFLANYYEDSFTYDHRLKFHDLQNCHSRIAITADYMGNYHSVQLFSDSRKNKKLSSAISKILFELLGNAYKFGKEISSDILLSHSVGSQFVRLEVQNLTTKEIFEECYQHFDKLYSLPDLPAYLQMLKEARVKYPNQLTRGVGLLSLLLGVPIRLGVAQITNQENYQINVRAFLNLETFAIDENFA